MYPTWMNYLTPQIATIIRIMSQDSVSCGNNFKTNILKTQTI